MTENGRLSRAYCMEDYEKQEQIINEIYLLLSKKGITLSDVKAVFCHVIDKIERENVISL